jgi:hypothetical protein
LLVLDRSEGVIVGLHKASFVVWLGATSLHVATRIFQLPPILRQRLTGTVVRLGVVAAALGAGLILAVSTLPAADQLQDAVSGSVGIDAH